jgi:hypothetical protein
MKEKEGYTGNVICQVELEDVLAAIDLGTDHVVEDWPWGRKQRCSMHFYVESNKRGERFVKQSTMNGRSYKPKARTYAERVTIIEILGKIGHVEFSKYGMVGVYVQDSKFSGETFFDEEAMTLAKHFFGSK